MTKKNSDGQKNKTGAGPGTAVILLVILLTISILFIADKLGLVDVNWQAVQQELENMAGTPTANQTPGVPVEGWYQLYFSVPQYSYQPADRAEAIENELIGVINQAQKTLDIAVYELNLDPVGEAILAARDRGVKVRLVTDSDSLEEDETLISLKKAKLPIVPDNRNAIMHDKFMVVDGQAVWTGSYNFTTNDTFRNNNNAIYIRSPQLAANYAAEFEEMFVQKAFGPTSPANTPYPQIKIGDTLLETCFAPEDKCADRLIGLIKGAQRSIRFMAFSFTHEGISQAVLDRAQVGVKVQGVFETRGSETEHSELARMQARKLDVWQDGNPYTLHHKVFILDDQIVVMGSFNFSDNADRSNDENMLVIHNAAIAAQYRAEFERVYTQAQNPPKK